MKKLIATHPILYQSTQYEVGRELPAHDSKMVQAWIDAGTAVWKEEQQDKAKASPAVAVAGLVGVSENGESTENLVGKIPETPARSKRGKKDDKKNV